VAVKLSSIKTDAKREAEGEWINIPEIPGVRLLVRSLNYGPYKNARSIMLGRLARRYGKDPVPDTVMSKELGDLYVAHILLGWEGFDVPYTEEVARQTLTDVAYRSLLDHIEYAANRVGQQEIEFVEAAAGNSPPPSLGS
jgi:hypothetical protein